MKRALTLLLIAALACPLFAGGNGESGGQTKEGAQGGAASDRLVILSYDSFNSEWGPGPEISKRFKAQTGINIDWIIQDSAGDVLASLLTEGKNSSADIVLGLDQNMAKKAIDSRLLQAYKPAGAEKLLAETLIDKEFRLIPFDYSYFAICYDSQVIPNPPQSLEDLTDPKYAKKLILMDPRTSSPGLGFLAWTQAIYGQQWQDYWRRLKPSILTISDGWSSGYGLFTSGEAPLVSSYTTSPGYHLEYENSDRYRAALFQEGHPIQVEMAGLLATSKNRENAQAFLDFMISPEFQEVIPLGNWMYPVIDIPLPPSFRVNPKSPRTLNPQAPSDGDLNAWAALMSEK